MGQGFSSIFKKTISFPSPKRDERRTSFPCITNTAFQKYTQPLKASGDGSRNWGREKAQKNKLVNVS
jgi:hypothetical protein